MYNSMENDFICFQNLSQKTWVAWQPTQNHFHRFIPLIRLQLARMSNAKLSPQRMWLNRNWSCHVSPQFLITKVIQLAINCKCLRVIYCIAMNLTKKWSSVVNLNGRLINWDFGVNITYLWIERKHISN